MSFNPNCEKSFALMQASALGMTPFATGIGQEHVVGSQFSLYEAKPAASQYACAVQLKKTPLIVMHCGWAAPEAAFYANRPSNV